MRHKPIQPYALQTLRKPMSEQPQESLWHISWNGTAPSIVDRQANRLHHWQKSQVPEFVGGLVNN
jgi:hypothetical protein